MELLTTDDYRKASDSTNLRMPQISFWEHPIDKLEEALSLRKQIAALQAKLGSLFSEHPPSLAAQPTKSMGTGKRTMSAAARAKIAAAQRARWAKQKGTTTAAASYGDGRDKSLIGKGKKAPQRKGQLSPEGRARIVAAMKARWAAKKRSIR